MALGRPVFALAVVAFGVQQFLCGDFVPGPLAAPSWIPWHPFWASVSAFVLVVAGVAVATEDKIRLGAILLGIVFFPVVAVFHLPDAVAILYHGAARTRAFEALAIGSIALVLYGGRFVAPGRVLFAIALVVFGIQHFIYVPYVVAAIPAWIPGKVFWTCFTGVALLAAAASLAFLKEARLGTALLGLMFLSWFVLLHIPRVVGRIGDANEWNSAFVALAMCGGAWVLSESLAARQPHRPAPARGAASVPARSR